MIDHFCYHSGPTVPVRGLNGTVTVVVQDKYARMLVLQGHCPLVPGLKEKPDEEDKYNQNSE